MFDSSKNFDDAQLECQANGATLAMIENEVDEIAVRHYMGKSCLFALPRHSLIAGHCLQVQQHICFGLGLKTQVVSTVLRTTVNLSWSG